MKRIFRTLIFVAMMTTTPFVFTSCNGLLDMLEEIIGEMEENGDGDDEYNEDNGTDAPEDYPTYEDPTEHNLYVEVECYETRLNIRELCAVLAEYPNDFKFDINCNECDWVRVEWEQWVDPVYEWTPFLVISSNETEDVREMSFSIDLGENNICNHSVLQHPY